MTEAERSRRKAYKEETREFNRRKQQLIREDAQRRIPAHHGEYLRQFRLDLGLSQAELGEKIGVGKTKISDWENRYRDIELDAIRRVYPYFSLQPPILEKNHTPGN